MYSRGLRYLLVILLPLLPALAQDKSPLPERVDRTATAPLYIPPDLAPWVEWVKERNPEWRCAVNNKNFECTWPGSLRYVLAKSGAEFVIEVETLKEGAVPLPSSAGLFPRHVSVRSESGENISAPLILEGGALSIRLPRGNFEVRGSFVWAALPPEIPAPHDYGLVDVVIPSELGALRARRGADSLWLEEKAVNPTTESLTLSVMRRVSDGSPLRIETLLKLRISGRSRPLQIAQVVPAGSLPVTIESPLPSQLSAQGALALQLLPGEYDVRVLSLMQQPVAAIKAPSVALPEWPKEEVWSFQPDMALRSVELSGGQPLHADLTQLPSDWKGGAVYVLAAGDELRLNETRRGEQSQAPNEIQLQREVWIDLEGRGATIQDRFQGRLNQEFRLNALPETKVGRATIDGQPVLVTLDPKSSAAGVELRNQDLRLKVVSRVEDSRTLAATGWGTGIDKLSLLLHLPPSWKLLHVAGAAEAHGSWVDSWSLLHIFVSILIILAVYKLFGWPLAAVLTLSLLLNHGEFLAPRMLYIHLLLLVVWRLLTSAKESVWRSLSQVLLAATYAAWLLQSLAFAKLQFTQFLFPQLQAGTRYRTLLQSFIAGLEDSLLVWPLLLAVLAALLLMLRSAVTAPNIGQMLLRVVSFGVIFLLLLAVAAGVLESTGRHARRSYQQASRMYDDKTALNDNEPQMGVMEEAAKMPSTPRLSKGKAWKPAANVQFSYQGKNLLSGPAVPSWRWRSYHVSIASPVASEHQLRFYLLSPWLSRLLCLVRALLALALVALFFRALGYSLSRVQRLGQVCASAAAVTLLLLWPHAAQAEIPTTKLLEELNQKLAQKICDRAQCTVVESVQFVCTEKTFKLALSVSSEGISSVLVPGPLDVLAPAAVRLNGKRTIALRRSRSGFLEVRTEGGSNLIELEGALPDPQSFSVQFGQKPLQVEVQAPSWYVEGLSASGVVQESLRFVSRSPKDVSKPVLRSRAGEGLHTWVRVRREVHVGEQISLNTQIERIGSAAREAHVRVPLLAREQVTSGEVSIENNELLVAFAAGVKEAGFSSVIPYASEVALSAKPARGVSEEWMIACEPIIACTFEGIKPVHSTVNGTRAFEWQPYPGEEVRLKAVVLSGIRGDFVTVDGVHHEVRWGANVLEGTLRASVRATQQTNYRITGPSDALIKKVTLDGEAGRSSEKANETSLLLSPGDHSVELSYSKPWSPRWKENAPPLALSSAANNLTVRVLPSADRWLLWTGGLAWGPCVVFWSKLLLVVLLCVALTKLSLLPCSHAGAVLLGIGLATLSLIVLVLPLAWLILLVLLPNLRSAIERIPRWLRVSVFVLLSVATLGVWYHIVQTGLVLQPPMLVVGNGSSASSLVWYTDHVTGLLPTPWVLSLPLWCWRVCALVWSTWLVIALFGWLRRSVEILRQEF